MLVCVFQAANHFGIYYTLNLLHLQLTDVYQAKGFFNVRFGLHDCT